MYGPTSRDMKKFIKIYHSLGDKTLWNRNVSVRLASTVELKESGSRNRPEYLPVSVTPPLTVKALRYINVYAVLHPLLRRLAYLEILSGTEPT